MAKVDDEILISALLTHTTNKEVAEVCGISEATLYNRLKEKDFQKKLDSARSELLYRNTTVLQGLLSSAINTMSDIMNSEENAPQTRLNASEAIFRNSMKLTEQVDILKRIEALETAMNSSE